MANIDELKDYIESLFSFAEAISSDHRDRAVDDILRFCAYIIAADNKLSPKEVNLLSELTGMQINPEDFVKFIQLQNWSVFENSVPMILQWLMIADKQEGKGFEKSRTIDFLGFLVQLGKAVAEADGIDKSEMERIQNYTVYLLDEVKVQLNDGIAKEYKRKSANTDEGKTKDQNKPLPPKADNPSKQTGQKTETPKPKPAASQAAKKASGAVSIPTTGPSTKLDFWQAFKPYIDQMRHTEFSKVKIKDDDCLDAKATVIVGVYNSILMRVSKNLLRLELYIDTETEAGNLQILDYIKAKIKVPSALKGKIDYERKEGRRAQRVCVSFPGFALTNRSCWGKYITEIMNVADDFFDAVEAPMRELISGS
jgi:hypothetical protein